VVKTLRLLLAIALLLIGPQAHAHGSVKGLGDFMGGFLHPLFEPAHLVALIALLLLVAQRGIHESTAVIGTLALATAVGLTAAVMGWPASTDTALLIAALLAGLTVTLARALPQTVLMVLAAAIGLGIGLGSEPEGLKGARLFVCLAGTWFGTCLYAISGGTLLEEFKRPWTPVLIRVVGSWMTATALLVLTLHTVGPPATLHGGTTSHSQGR
jgi:hydrogenase/urease accessory protein HupE